MNKNKSQGSKLGIMNRANNSNNETRTKEEKIIKKSSELLPEWLKNAVNKINGINYTSNTFFIEKYQQIARNEIKYFEEHQDHHVVDEALKEINENRSRYMNIFPYDYNRVKLLNESKVSETETSDFINASIITNPYTEKASYIATQGPMKETCSDFWQMVWEQNVYLIVMVAREMENNVIKCAIYWPTEKDTIYEIDFPNERNNNTVKVNIELVLKDISRPTENIIKRTIELKEVEINRMTNEHKIIKTREVIHLQFIAWPDHDEPYSISSFIDLIKLSKEIKNGVKNSDKYNDLEKNSLIVVHCSAGVGRTGTFITLDVLFDFYYDLFQRNNGFSFKDKALINSFDKIQECIVHLRKQRVLMVQSLQQLAFCYKALAYELISFQSKE